MRKLIAVLLTAVLLVSTLAVLPVSAASTTYDGTTADTAGLNTIFISEIGSAMYYHRYGTNAGTYRKSMNFIELFNNGAGDVELDAISLLQAVEIDTVPKDASSPYLQAKRVGTEDRPLWREWRDAYRFISKMDIKSGKIIEDAEALKYGGLFTDGDPSTPNTIDNDRTFNMLTNEGVDMTFSDGDNVVIWMVNAQTITWMNWLDAQMPQFDPRAEFVTSYYGVDADPDDYKIVMVWAYSDYTVEDASVLADNMFTLDNVPNYNDDSKNYILGVADSDWALNIDRAYTAATQSAEASISDKLYSMTVMGTKVPRYTGTRVSDVSATFAPANTTPHIANAYARLLDECADIFFNYFDAGYVESFRETGTINWTDCNPTPGAMPDWQWAMVDPDNAKAPDTLKTDGAKDAGKVQAAIDAYIAALGYVDDGVPGREEPDLDYEFVEREDLIDKFYPSQDETETVDEAAVQALAEQATALFALVSGNAPISQIYRAIVELGVAYEEMNSVTQDAVSEEVFEAVEAAMTAYNQRADKANEALGSSVKQAFAPIRQMVDCISGFWYAFKEFFAARGGNWR